MLGFTILTRAFTAEDLDAVETDITLQTGTHLNLPNRFPYVAQIRGGGATEEIEVDGDTLGTLTVTRSLTPSTFVTGAEIVTEIHLEWPDIDGQLALLSDITGGGTLTVRHNNSTTEGTEDTLDFLDSNTIEWAFTNPSGEVQATAEVVALLETGGPTVLPITSIGASQLIARSTISTIVGYYPSEALDLIGSTAGAILYRSSGSGASGWVLLAPGPNTGRVLTEHGSGAPTWTDDATVGAVPLHSAAAIQNIARPFAPISNRQFGLLSAPTNAGTAMVAIGNAGQQNTGGTQAFGTRSTASYRQSLTRQSNTTGTGANATAGWTMHGSSSANFLWRGNGAGLGGIFFEAIFAISTTLTTMSFEVGIHAFNAAPTGYSSPLATTDTVFVGCDSGDSNLHIYSNDSAGNIVSAADLGSNFAKSSTSNVYHVIFQAPPNGGTFTYWVREIVNAHEANGTISSQLPTSTTFLSGQIHLSNNGSGTPGAVALDIMSMYEESPLA